MARKEQSRINMPDPLESWAPKTEIGEKVQAGEIASVNELLQSGKTILESEIIDTLVPGIEHELLLVGQSKGKFGGGQRRAFKQTQKKTKEGNKPSFTTYAVVGNRNGLVGVGWGKAKETVPAREKAIRQAKLSLIQVQRGSGSWQTVEPDQNSIPFKVTGKCGSIKITLIPAPKGTGLVVEKECQKILELAGIKDVWSKTEGKTNTKFNLIKACYDALQNLSKVKVRPSHKTMLGMDLKRQQEMKKTAEELAEASNE